MTFGKDSVLAENVPWFWQNAESHAVMLYASSSDCKNLTHR